ncbi:UNVERIFIED_CONTAM: hypothetical protein Slati_2107200 [Sesamum latifolium]|uniref:Tf2-1-like SH3-like domain-containing protein n=1 Tax=Sesamum latifolium TaxID=2727402 RepID=A0AAW2WQ34_9LAMI
MPPYQALYGHAPPTITNYIDDATPLVVVDEHLRQRKEIITTTKYYLTRARERMKLAADLHRRDVEYQVGDWVLLRLHPYRQTSVRRRSSQKLSRQFFGPFRVQRKIGVVAYELELPAGAKIHPVFHISLLKLYRGSAPTHGSALPPELTSSQPVPRPIRVLGRRLNAASAREQLLVQWEDQEASDATWMDGGEFRSNFSLFDLEDKVDSDGAGNDTGFDPLTDQAISPALNEDQPDSGESGIGPSSLPIRRSSRQIKRPTKLDSYY